MNGYLRAEKGRNGGENGRLSYPHLTVKSNGRIQIPFCPFQIASVNEPDSRYMEFTVLVDIKL